MALFTKDIPEGNGKATPRRCGQRKFLQPLLQTFSQFARLCHAGEVPFDIRHENSRSHTREGFSKHLHADSLARSGCSSDATMTVGHLGQQYTLTDVVLSDGNRLGYSDGHGKE